MSYGGLINWHEGVTWKNLYLGDDKISARMGKKWEVQPPPPFLHYSLSNPNDVQLEAATKERPWESLGGMTQLRDEGGEAVGVWY